MFHFGFKALDTLYVSSIGIAINNDNYSPLRHERSKEA